MSVNWDEYVALENATDFNCTVALVQDVINGRKTINEVRAEIGLSPLPETRTGTGKPVEIECGRVRIVTDGFGRGNVYFDGVESDLSIVGLKYEVSPGEMDKLHLTVNPAMPKMQPDDQYKNSVRLAEMFKMREIIANRSVPAANPHDVTIVGGGWIPMTYSPSGDGLESPTIVEKGAGQ